MKEEYFTIYDEPNFPLKTSLGLKGGNFSANKKYVICGMCVKCDQKPNTIKPAYFPDLFVDLKGVQRELCDNFPDFNKDQAIFITTKLFASTENGADGWLFRDSTWAGE